MPGTRPGMMETGYGLFAFRFDFFATFFEAFSLRSGLH
jgi:hypothetical protein